MTVAARRRTTARGWPTARGVDRPNLRMEYGGLVQGFQIIGFGDWAVKAHGIGRTQTGYELFYQSANAPGVSYSPTDGYPAIETVEVYDNVADKNDLNRRVKQRAMTASRLASVHSGKAWSGIRL